MVFPFVYVHKRKEVGIDSYREYVKMGYGRATLVVGAGGARRRRRSRRPWPESEVQGPRIRAEHMDVHVRVGEGGRSVPIGLPLPPLELMLTVRLVERSGNRRRSRCKHDSRRRSAGEQQGGRAEERER